MTGQRFEELFNKAYEGGSLDSTEAVELVDELDSAYKKISEQNRLIALYEIEIRHLSKMAAQKEGISA